MATGQLIVTTKLFQLRNLLGRGWLHANGSQKELHMSEQLRHGRWFREWKDEVEEALDGHVIRPSRSYYYNALFITITPFLFCYSQ